MSTGAQVAVLDARGLRHTRPRSETHPESRPTVRLLAFAALGLYGALRWGTMLSPAPVPRTLGLLGLAVALAAAGALLWRHSRALVLIIAAGALVAVFPLAGIPLSWVRHVRLAVGADAIDQGLQGLPRALIPYTGINQWVRTVITLGGGLLLLLSALTLALGSPTLRDGRRAAAALPLIVLAVVPSTLARPHVAYLHGLILFVLLAAFLWGERVARHDAPMAVGIVALAGAAAMIAAPALDRHTPWLNYEALAGRLAPGHVEAFDWTQGYGPLNWPRTGREVLDVAARTPDYWKTEDLELFNGTGWAAGSTDYGAQAPPPSAASIGRWSQTIQVTLRGMRSQQVIGAGYSGQPVDLAQAVTPGLTVGTWSVPGGLAPGDSYRVTTYSPRPSAAELAGASTRIPAVDLQGDLTMIVKQQQGLPDAQILFAPFGVRAGPIDIANVTGLSGNGELAASPYAGVYALALRLRHQTHTPAAYISKVMGYLAHGYTYDESPPPSSYPLVSFLLGDRHGYCQQFAGAMALLLRMGGVPARVATGFTTGQFDHASGRYIISDLDAHAWVEAWFPRYGWVRFDPTPASAPARAGRALLPALKAPAQPAKPTAPVRHGGPLDPAAPVTHVSHSGGGSSVPLLGVGALALVLGALALAGTVRWREPDERGLLGELERAFARTGRPLGSGVTLAALERRLRSAPQAAGYISALREMRFASGGAAPTLAQRRALRAQLRLGLGPLARIRALWALPPRWAPRFPRRRASR